jgi:hypothetical protein
MNTITNNSSNIDMSSNQMTTKKKSIVMNASVKFGGKSARVGAGSTNMISKGDGTPITPPPAPEID